MWARSTFRLVEQLTAVLSSSNSEIRVARPIINRGKGLLVHHHHHHHHVVSCALRSHLLHDHHCKSLLDRCCFNSVYYHLYAGLPVATTALQMSSDTCVDPNIGDIADGRRVRGVTVTLAGESTPRYVNLCYIRACVIIYIVAFVSSQHNIKCTVEPVLRMAKLSSPILIVVFL